MANGNMLPVPEYKVGGGCGTWPGHHMMRREGMGWTGQDHRFLIGVLTGSNGQKLPLLIEEDAKWTLVRCCWIHALIR